MRKLFTFLSLSAIVLSSWATTITLTPGEDKIKAAIASATAGDIIELTDGGVYTEWNTITIDKAITLRAATGVKPVVHAAKICPNAQFEADGIEFYLNGSDYQFRTTAGGDFSVTFRNCLLRDCSTIFYYLSSGQSINALTIDNCIFCNNTVRAENGVINGQGNVGVFTMTNSTVYNISGKYGVRVLNGTSATIDHCTFYNCGERVVLVGEDGGVTNVAVSNCVVANPTSVAGYCIATYTGTVDNCVYYNTASGPRSSATVTGCVNADPLFMDAANADFSFRYASPLYKGATDGTNIGDPRWSMQLTTEVNLPTTLNMANAEAYTAPVYNTDYFDFGPNDRSEDLRFFALWTVNVTSGMYDIAVDLTSENGYNLELYLMDIESGSTLKTVTAATSSSASSRTLDLTDVAAGRYLLMLKNTKAWSKVKVRSVALTSAGGTVVNIPATLNVADAIFSAEGTRADGFITFPPSTINNDEIVYNIHASKAGNYAIDLTISTTNGHKYLVEIYDNTEALVASVAEASQSSADGTIALGQVLLSAGDYKVKIINQTQWSEAKYQSLTFTYKGGATIALPGVMLAEDALEMTGKVGMDGEGHIAYINHGEVPSARVKWNISVAEAGQYQVTLNMNASNTSGHRCQVDVLNSSDVVVASVAEPANSWSHNNTELGTMDLQAGTYTLVLINNTTYSSAIIDGITFSYIGALSAPTYDLTITAAGMSTLVLPFDVDDVPAGLKVYKLTTSASDEITAAEETAIQADKPVLVIGAAGNYHFEGTGSSDISGKAGVYSYGALRGTYSQIEAPLTVGGENVYVLQKHGDEVAFYQLDASSNKTIKPYRAYLCAVYNSLSTPSPAPMRIRFQTDTATDLEATAPAVSLDEALRDGKVYDLLGRRVYAIPAAGLYIVDGQKMFIR